jgi:hypothetical protein
MSKEADCTASDLTHGDKFGVTLVFLLFLSLFYFLRRGRPGVRILVVAMGDFISV